MCSNISSFSETDSPPHVRLTDFLNDVTTPTTPLPAAEAFPTSVFTAAPTPVSPVSTQESTTAPIQVSQVSVLEVPVSFSTVPVMASVSQVSPMLGYNPVASSLQSTTQLPARMP